MPIPVMTMMLMAAGSGQSFVITLSVINEASVNSSNGPCSAGVRVQSDGDLETGFSNSSSSPSYSEAGGSPHEWASPDDVGDPGAQHQARMVYGSGAHLDVGNEDTWEVLTSDLEYNVNAVTGPKTVTFNGTLEIRKGTGPVLDSAAVTLAANSFMI